MALLEAQDLAVRYGKALALERVSLRVETNELVGVLGPNGAGKTTLLKAISGVLASTGMLRFNGENLGGIPAYRVAALGICHCQAVGSHGNPAQRNLRGRNGVCGWRRNLFLPGR